MLEFPRHRLAPTALATPTRRVLIVTRDDPAKVQGGVETFCEHLQRVFPGSRVLAYAGAAGPRRVFNEARDARAARAGVEAELAEYPAEAVVANGAAAWAWSDASNLPPVVTVYHGTYAGFGRVLGRRQRWQGLWSMGVGGFLERRAGHGRRAVAVSPAVAEEVARYYGLTAEVIDNAVDLSRDAEPRRRGVRAPRVLFVGRPTWTKGFDLVQRLAARRPDWRVFAAGSPSGRHDAVIGLGELAPHDLHAWYRRADLVIAPSRYEGCSYVPLEAMAEGTPVVTSAVGAFRVVGEQPFGAVVPVAHDSALEAAVEAVLRHAERCTPQDWVRDLHGYEDFARRWRSLIEEVVR